LRQSEPQFRPTVNEIMNSHTSLTLVVTLLLLACDKDKRSKPSTDDTAPTHDTGPAPDSDPDCDTGYLEDDGECVPAACGTGTWGNLERDENTVYVDINAAVGGIGSETAPFASIQAGLDAAGDADGGTVAVAAGTYPETLELGREHDGVHLSGRCRELVVIDASVGDESTPGIDVDAKSSDVQVSGVTVRGAHYVGIRIGSGSLTVRDSRVEASEFLGLGAYQSGNHQTSLLVEDSVVFGNTALGLLAYEPGTTVTLRRTTIQDSLPDADGVAGYGIQVRDGATLSAESCEIAQNTAVGLAVWDSSTSVSLRETIVRDTLPATDGTEGFGIEVCESAVLDAEACEVAGNAGVGVAATDSSAVALNETVIHGTFPNAAGEGGAALFALTSASMEVEACELSWNTAGVVAYDSGTRVTLRETTIQHGQPDEYGNAGYGVEVSSGASLAAEGCQILENTTAGVLAFNVGTSVTLSDTTVASTRRGEFYTVGVGISAFETASVDATGVEVRANEGPALYAAREAASLSCSGCTLSENTFAAAVAIMGASLAIEDSLVEGTGQQENIGGGLGIYAAPLAGNGPALVVTSSTIQDNAIAGVWLSGAGSYSLSDNIIRGGDGWTRESLTKCGDAVYATEGVTAWDGSSGLLLERNELLDGMGAGLFLDNASASLLGNSYADNAVDLVMQGGDCETPPDGYEGETFSSDVELCPTYDYATCGDKFTLHLTIEDPGSGYGAALMSPGLPGPGALPALPVALPHAFDPLPLLPPAPRLEPLKLRLEPLRHEPAPPVPLVAPGEH